MAVLLGIDIGTSSSKVMMLDVEKGIIDVEAVNYDVDVPLYGYAQQDAEVWWESVVSILNEMKTKHAKEYGKIAAISFSGQMHGCVVVDKEGKPLRPGIIWLDQRSKSEVNKITDMFGMEHIKEILHNRLFSGFALPSLLWIKEKEPKVFKNIYKMLLPKDYVRYKMTGEFGTEASDASATTGFHVKERDWAWDLIDLLGMPRDIFPKCHESIDIAGYITNECAKVTGLKVGIPIVFGCGDQPAHIIGAGVVKEGTIVSNIGTGGEMSVYSSVDKYDYEMRIHTFCHAVNRAYTIFGAHLCSGMSMKWLKNQILNGKDFETMSEMASEIDSGSEGLIYLPYLTGSRTPEMDVSAKGMFFGLQLNHDKRHFIRAVMEGVIYDFKRSQDIFEEMDIHSDRIIACGGGAKSPQWLQIQADILEREVQVCEEKEQACLGACIIAGIGVGIFENVEEACKRYVKMETKVYAPNPKTFEAYRNNYNIYSQLYQVNKSLMSGYGREGM